MKSLDRLIQRFRINQVLPYVGRNSRVLDIGCADGALYDRARHIREYVGIDPDAPIGRTRSGAEFVRSSFPTTALNSGRQFDLIAALAILEHVPVEGQPEFAAACAAHLRPGGILAITVPSPAVDALLAVLKRVNLVDGMHEEQHYGYRPSTTPGLFSAHGLDLVRHKRFEFGLNHLFVFRKPASS